MSENVKYLKSANQVTIYLNGESYSLSSDNSNFGSVCSLLKSNKWNDRRIKKLRSLISKSESVIEYFDSNGCPIRIENGVIFYGEFQIQSSIVNRILEMKRRGLKPHNLLRFVERLSDNPSTQSVNELYEFLAKNNIPIREDGKFLSYKRVRENYHDIHSGKFDNSPGQIVRLKGRKDVDPNREVTCSYGLHVCAYQYLDSFGSNDSASDRVVIVAVDPADVVSVPTDYNNSKMRVIGYEVLEDIGDWRSIRLKDFSVDGEDIYASVDEEIDFSEDYVDEKYEDSDDDDDIDPIIHEYGLDSNDGFEYLEGFSNFHPIEYSAVGHDYNGFILAEIPKGVSVTEIISFLKKCPDGNEKYSVDDENPYSFLSYFYYVVDLKRNVDEEKNRFLVVLTGKDGSDLDELRLATPSVSFINQV